MFRNILFVVEPGADNAAALATTLILADENQAKLCVARTIDIRRSSLSDAYYDAMISELEEELGALIQGKSLSTGEIGTVILTGEPCIEIVRNVIQQHRDLVIKASASKNSGSANTMDMRLFRQCPCPVWIIKFTRQRSHRKIAVALDWDPGNIENDQLNAQLMKMGLSLALSTFSTLHVLHAWQLRYESFLRSHRTHLTNDEVDEMLQDERLKHEAWLRAFVTSATEALGDEVSAYLEPETHLLQGQAFDVVPQCVHELQAELLIMGTVARTGIPGFIIGNTAEKILTRIDCSTLTAKPEGFVSPILA